MPGKLIDIIGRLSRFAVDSPERPRLALETESMKDFPRFTPSFPVTNLSQMRQIRTKSQISMRCRNEELSSENARFDRENLARDEFQAISGSCTSEKSFK